MRYLIAALVAALLPSVALAQAAHPLNEREKYWLAYAGCTEARGEPGLGQHLVQFVLYMRGIDARHEWGGWNLEQVAHKRNQFVGVTQGRCPPRELQRSLAIAQDVIDGQLEAGDFFEARYFLEPRTSSPGGRAEACRRFFLGKYGNHYFFRDRRRGEPGGHAPFCGPTYAYQ